MQAAAVAVRYGGRLLDYLDLSDPVEMILADEILMEVQEQEIKRHQQFLKDLEVVVSNGIAKAFK